MSKAKIIIATFIAALALSAVASASASAAGWMVNGAEITKAEALATTAKVTKNGELTASGVTIECNGSTLDGTTPQIEDTNKGSAGSLIFLGCKSITANCSISKTEIGTVPIIVEATLEGATGVSASFTPKTGTIFTTIKYEGAECALLGVKPVTGKAKVTDSKGKEESVTQEIVANVTEASKELKVGSSGASLKGAAQLKLANSEPWSLL